MAPTGKPRGRPRKSNSSSTTASSSRPSDPLGSFPAPPMAPSFVDSAYGSQPQSQPDAYGDPIKNNTQTSRIRLKPVSPVEARTPIHKNASPSKQGPAKMTVGQKQALIDNLRLEITERARRLRAQYAQSAASLRRRLEMRIHRVPAALRKLTMGEVIERHEQKVKAEAEAKTRRVREAEDEEQRRNELAAAKAEEAAKKRAAPAPKQTRGVKRSSDEVAQDQENKVEPLPNKRARPNTATVRATATKSNTTARRAPPSAATAPPAREVLSPKSHNSRTYPISPFKSPAKPLLSRPTSPLKPSVQLSPSKPVTIPANVPAVANLGTASSMAKTKSTAPAPKASTLRGTSSRAPSRAGPAPSATKSTRAATVRGQKATKTVVHIDDTETSMVTRQTRNSAGRGRNSNGSDESAVSNGTTIVRKMPAKSMGNAKAAVGNVRQKAATINKRVATKTVVPTASENVRGESVRGGRTLRKRP